MVRKSSCRFGRVCFWVLLGLVAGSAAACGGKADPAAEKTVVIETEAETRKDAGAGDGAEVSILLEGDPGAGTGQPGNSAGTGTGQAGNGAGNGNGQAGNSAGTGTGQTGHDAGSGNGQTGLPGSGGAGREAETGSNGEEGEDSGFRTSGAGQAGTAGGESHTETENALKEQFGEDCIAGQTFEVELSEFHGKVWFVPYAPAEPGQDLHMQIVQNGQILTEIPAYVPEGMNQEDFESLDAVSFYDINYDGNTDILTVATYGGKSLAAIYYGEVPEGTDGREPYFYIRDRLSDKVSAQVEPLTVSQIRIYLSWGRKNGSFNSEQEAYDTVVRLCELESDRKDQYDLIDFDGDGTPELLAGDSGNVSMYTYSQGIVYTLMDHWVYGAMGNAGYEYSPGKNSLRNYNTDYAGAILYTTYMTASGGHTMEPVVSITTCNFDDANGNGVPDPEEEGSLGMYGVSYINGEEATEEQCAAYDLGGYVYMEPSLSAEELRARLGI